MARLQVERDDRTRIESTACIEIQRIARGFLQRPKSGYVCERKERKEATRFLMNVKTNLTSDLLEMTEMVGLPPIPGMTLDSKKMIEQQKIEDELRRLDQQRRASVQIQSCIRQRIGKNRVDAIKKEKHKAMITMLTIKIQKVSFLVRQGHCVLHEFTHTIFTKHIIFTKH